MPTDTSHALDHIVVVLFENRSLDNLLGHLYGPGDGKTFEGVLGKHLSNPIPEWAEHGADRKVVPYTVATDMDAPNPDSGEEYPHTNTQLFDILSEENRFQVADDMTAPWNAPAPGQTPTMDGFVTDYISTFTAETGRQPTYDEYSQIMTGYTPDQVPVLNGLARAFGVFDHWFCEVPSQTFMNRSFRTAGTSSGLVVNEPRDPASWPVPTPRPVPAFNEDDAALGKVVSRLGKTLLDGVRQHAADNNIKLDGAPDDPNVDVPPENIVTVLRSAASLYFPQLAPTSTR
ncbi:MAG: alkaline phosphatase family protein [Ilumatobacteraceae bacterium]